MLHTDFHLPLKSFLAAFAIVNLSRVVLIHNFNEFTQDRRVLQTLVQYC